ncbi:ectonucleotide pyrophosphatase/phosphodiesterase family member 5-like protein [Dinothrombium tinctorium]|uniref:Ectonucleotide pyrophosphatase/phosphodiesterase family member 5-like protein n=1 Tax=Dinothrombium tinctorium TaxID=1965070 RepID=A0A443QA30_9ACAR|nr:ectonucleotide pyrophosphatase/phosphodiesterase family member 5-like protein [Dinothrombium tinctorium]RWS06835.1 ectonucleotide pyrophosphatase/phosphodiesterase family member 5-like protein [Dinothrombium tinctorium]
MFEFARNGVRATNMRSTFTTKTFPNHYSIVTGYYQETHGIVNNQIFDPLFNETFTLATRGSKWWDNGLSIPIWVANQMIAGSHKRYSFVSMWPGSWERIHGQKPYYLEPYNKTSNWNARIDRMIKLMLDKQRPANLAVLYFDEPDSTSHYYGPFSNQTRQQIRRADSLINYLLKKLKKANLSSKTNIIILSDHGMAEVPFEKMIDLNKISDTSLYRVYGSAPVLNVLANEGEKERVYEMLKKASFDNHFAVYKREDVPKQYHYSNHRRILDIIIEADEGYYADVQINKWFPGKYMGVHGYNNSLLSMRPLFLASGPAFKKGLVYEEIFENIDLYPLMCKILNIGDETRFPSNGTFSKVDFILKT